MLWYGGCFWYLIYHFFRDRLWKNLIFSECLKYPKGHDTNNLLCCNFMTRQWFSCFSREVGKTLISSRLVLSPRRKGLHIQMTDLSIPRKYLAWTVFIRIRTALWRTVWKIQSLPYGSCLQQLKCSMERKPVFGCTDTCIAELAKAVTVVHDVTPDLWGLCDNPQLHLLWEPDACLKPTKATVHRVNRHRADRPKS